MNGPRKVLVPQTTATLGHKYEDEDTHGIARSHSELVKFKEHDEDRKAVSRSIEKMAIDIEEEAYREWRREHEKPSGMDSLNPITAVLNSSNGL